MQRRAVPSVPSQPTATSSPATTAAGRTAGISTRNAAAKKKAPNNRSGSSRPVLMVVLLVASLVGLSWIFFPSQVLEVEHQAAGVGKELVKEARQAERQVEDWWQQHELAASDNTDAVEDPATARMEAQSSKWVDGEKALKKKLQVLYDKQQKGELLGVPVLTRYLGEDIPAWVEPGMDEAEWKQQVDAKYAEMREEEEQWKKDMAKLVEQRERDLGITTA